ncbi:MAG: efflux RND transporter periplasmic adaptor subunit [Oxalobacteraceae bacterium]
MSTRSRRVVLLIIAIAAIAAGAAFFMRPKAPAAPVKAVATPPVLEFLPQEVFTTAPLDLQKTLSLSGALRAFDTATVKARVAADVREVLVREGEAVKSGQIIVKMDATEYLARVEQARGNLNAARAQLDIATKNRDNNRALVDKGFISRNAFENYASQYAAAEATVEAAKAALDVVQKSLNDTVIRAPISGLIAMRYVQPGEKVSADHKLLDIVDLRKMELEAAVPTSDIASVALHQRVMLRVEGLGQQFEGKVVRINPATQAGSRSVLVYVRVDNPQGSLRAGMFAEAQLVLASRPGVLALPQNAVRKDGNGAYVYVIDGERLARKPVVTGMNGRSGSEFMTEIQSGLDFGTTIIATDMGSLQPGSLARIATTK